MHVCRLHSNHTYCMLNLRTHKILISRDVIWMNRLFGDNDETPQMLPDDDEDDLGDPTTEPDKTPSAPPTAAPPNPPTPPPAPHIPHELCNLHSDLAPSLLGPGNRQTGRERVHLMSDDPETTKEDHETTKEDPETTKEDPYELLRQALNQTLPDFALLTAAVTKSMQNPPTTLQLKILRSKNPRRLGKPGTIPMNNKEKNGEPRSERS